MVGILDQATLLYREERLRNDDDANNMKILGGLLLLAVKCATVSSDEIFINPWFIPSPNQPYENLTAEVGDIIYFIWNSSDEDHNVYIYPSGLCDNTATDNIEVGLTSPASYVFTDADVEVGSLFFGCAVGSHCDLGMKFVVDVLPSVTNDTDTPNITQSDSPSASPTEAPSVVSTDAPTITASAAPTTGMASDAPSEPPTVAPSVAETLSPIAEPTIAPSDPLTETPVEAPTTAPTLRPTAKPSAPPTPRPTAKPTGRPVQLTDEPTTEPTPAPQEGSTTETLEGLRMGMAGISDMPGSTQAEWAELTASFSTSFIFAELAGTVDNFATTLEVTDVIPQNDRKQRRGTRRNLQGQEQVIVVYTQTMTYDTNDLTITPDTLATAPFKTDEERTAYVTLLGTSSDPVLGEITAVSPVDLEGTPTSAPAAPPSDSSSGVLSTPAIIGIACGGGAVVIMAVLYLMYCRSSSSSDDKKGDEPPLHVSINGDDVSTLAGPAGPPTYGDHRYVLFVLRTSVDIRSYFFVCSFRYSSFLHHQTLTISRLHSVSVATMDYDYSKAYGGAGDTSVSSAGGTFGSNTQHQSLLDPANAAATGATLGGSDFHSSYRDPKANVRDDVIHIFAPPGKLGVVIDTPDDGAPVVHAVKDTSVIAQKIQVGDKLVAVDDEDVRSMTAIKVSKLISRKSANPSRKLTVVRTTVIGN